MSIAAASTIPPGDHARTITSSIDDSRQPYRLYVPTAISRGEPLPLMVVLHGKGVDHNAWFDLTPVTRYAEQYGYIAVAPNGRGGRYYEGPGEQDVLDIIAELQRSLPVNPDRIYLTGHSMGGWGVWHIGLRHPDIFAAVCPMSAVAPPRLLDMLPNARHLAPLIIHDEDDDVVPVTQSRLPTRRLIELGISCQYREEHGYAHSSRLIADNLPRIIEWFDCHRLVRCPERVTLAAAPGDELKAYWLEIPRIDPDAAGSATVDATMESPGHLAIRTSFLSELTVLLDQLPGKSSAPLQLTINGKSFDLKTRVGLAHLQAAGSSREWRCNHIESPGKRDGGSEP
ncbi:MAG: prolyl oligopeptidase family serine peptidase [Phycisphaerae bacterium]|nr:prolyl oligopeptidase family serine peptidase [Phycisphaerae bacterium]